MRNNFNLKIMARSGVGYGIGFAAGYLLIAILLHPALTGQFVNLLPKVQIFLRILFGLAALLFILGLGGFVGGAVGGYVLGTYSDAVDKRRVMWRGGWSFFFANLLVIVPALLVTAVISFANPDLDTSFSKLPRLFAVVGLFYGAIGGFLTGWLTVGLRHAWRTVLAGVAGFGVGGALFGLLIRLGNPFQSDTLVATLTLVAGLFLFGCAGGAGLGLAYRYIHEDLAIAPHSRAWRVAKYVTLSLIILFLLSAAGKLISTLTIRLASVSETLELSTQGVGWLPAEPSVLPPEALADATLVANCDSGQVRITRNGQPAGTIPDAGCEGEAAVVTGPDKAIHVVWYASKTLKSSGAISNGNYFYESIGRSGSWTEPALIARPDGVATPILTKDNEGQLIMGWQDNEGEHAVVQPGYTCDPDELSTIGRAIYDVSRRESFRPASDPLPFCQNQFVQVLYTPNPKTSPSTSTPSENGAFDRVAELVTKADYEVLFVTMQWDKPDGNSSPGLTLAKAIAELYEKIKANPGDYPRGMTVRILLGNIPDLAIFEPTSQIYHVLEDLDKAGVAELENPELGWTVEVADFDGAWPHAHSKFAVIDGAATIAAGFNYSYLHLPIDHPSGKGLGMSDKGLEFLGPVAQSAMSAYDDLWSGSDILVCDPSPPPIPLVDFLWCHQRTAEATHTPEVLRIVNPKGNSNTFALHHTFRHLEADEAITAAILAAEDTIDLQEVNFSLDTVCIVAFLLSDLCDVDEVATPYLETLLKAIDENDVHVRVIMEPAAMNGLENRIAIDWLYKRLQEIGKVGNLEARFAANKMHDKAIMLDDEFLIVGSQNFHWSAWGTPSLTEYNLATDNPVAAADFKNEYELQWTTGSTVEIQASDDS